MVIKKCTTVAGEIIPKSHFCDYLLQTGQKLTFDLDLVFQIKNIENLIQRSPYSLQQWTNAHTAQKFACAPRQGKNECEYTKTTRKYPREDFILTKKTLAKCSSRKTRAISV
jgi:hypothetical protein